MSHRKWDLNASTGHYILRVARDARVLRMSDSDALFKGEYWGDHSFDFPVSEGWTSSLDEALRSIRRLREKHHKVVARRRRLASATVPHGRCSDVRGCVEPVPREEKCR